MGLETATASARALENPEEAVASRPDPSFVTLLSFFVSSCLFVCLFVCLLAIFSKLFVVRQIRRRSAAKDVWIRDCIELLIKMLHGVASSSGCAALRRDRRIATSTAMRTAAHANVVRIRTCAFEGIFGFARKPPICGKSNVYNEVNDDDRSFHKIRNHHSSPSSLPVQ